MHFRPADGWKIVAGGPLGLPRRGGGFRDGWLGLIRLSRRLSLPSVKGTWGGPSWRLIDRSTGGKIAEVLEQAELRFRVVPGKILVGKSAAAGIGCRMP